MRKSASMASTLCSTWHDATLPNLHYIILVGWNICFFSYIVFVNILLSLLFIIMLHSIIKSKILILAFISLTYGLFHLYSFFYNNIAKQIIVWHINQCLIIYFINLCVICLCYKYTEMRRSMENIMHLEHNFIVK